jgi:uncharacterized small protein (DUF1192 family)
MFNDEEIKRPKAHEVGMVLDAMSVEELTDRISLLEGEIVRLRDAIDAKKKSRSAADSVFRM